MAEELEVLKLVCRRLEKASIPYMVTGSIAANFFAVPRMTRDIDIVIQIKKGDAPRLDEIFKNDFYIDQDSITEAGEKRGMFNIIHYEYVFKVDFIVQKDSPYRKLQFERRRKVEMEGEPLWVTTPEDLILSKLDWAKESGSELQLRDVQNLLHTLSDLDQNYLQQWACVLGLEGIYSKVTHE